MESDGSCGAETANTRPRLLVVDDEPSAVAMLKRALRRTYDVLGAHSYDEATRVLDEADVDLVISDNRMPGRSGIDLLEHVREAAPRAGRILVTAFSDANSTSEAINRAAVHAFLHKPIRVDEIRFLASEVIARKRLESDNQQLLLDLATKNSELAAALTNTRAAMDRAVRYERRAAVGTMTAMVAHDLRQPIAVVRSAARSLLASAAAPAVTDTASEILDESDRMLETCASLLDYVRDDTKAVDGSVDLDRVCQRIIGDLCGDPLLATRLTFAPGGDATIAGSEVAVARAIQNLVRNAIDAAGPNGTVRIATKSHDGGVSVRVEDDGPGVAEEMRGRIFEPFVTAGKRRGTGLGLAIVRRIAEEHAGRVTLLESELGGACFEFFVAVAPLD